MNMMVARERLYITADKKKLVPEGHKDGAFLYAAPGDQIPESAAILFGLVDGALPAKPARETAPANPPPPAKTAAASKAKAPAKPRASAKSSKAGGATKEAPATADKEADPGQDKGSGESTPAQDAPQE